MAPPKAYCTERNAMAESLMDIAVRLSIAAAEMADVAGVSRNPAFVKAKLAAEQLRDECEQLRSDLSRHRLQHGC